LEALVGDVIIEEWTVLGMTCGGCAASVERVLGGVSGLRAVRADFAADLVTLEFDAEGADRASARAQIEGAGFDVRDDA
jgi:copper chaperone CopZ